MGKVPLSRFNTDFINFVFILLNVFRGGIFILFWLKGKERWVNNMDNAWFLINI